MQDEWIVETLNDLRDFALRNGLPALAERIDGAVDVARVELAARSPAAAPREFPAK